MMQKQLEVARKHLEDGNEVDVTLPDAGAKTICSGGIANGWEPPGLYTDPNQALEEWLAAVWQVLRVGVSYRMRWVAPPEMERYVITMQDRRGTQRVVSTRYAVTSKLVCVEKENGEGSKPDDSQVPSGDGGVA